MKSFLIVTMIFAIGFSLVQSPLVYSLDFKNNSFSYYEKNCKNDACVITTCNDGQACNTSENMNTTNNNTQMQLAEKESYGSNNLDFKDLWKNFMNFDR